MAFDFGTLKSIGVNRWNGWHATDSINRSREDEMTKSELQQLKEAFYEWLGRLSVEEIMSNHCLIERVKVFERCLLALG